jgi:twitching motility protein PilU
MELHELLHKMAAIKGSDLYLSTGSRPVVRVNNKLIAISEESLKIGQVKNLAYSQLSSEQILIFESKLEQNLAISLSGLGRFRVNIFVQRGEVGMVIRRILTYIPNFEELQLPEILASVSMEKRGLVLIVGSTGSGKSTTLASMIDHRNKNSSGHIITIEDPIEYIHNHQGCVINQREVGIDTLSYEDALKNALRQAPDVILIGEIRSRETMEQAIAFAETGHLCISTLHANNANQALDRIINFFPADRRRQLLLDLSFNLKMIFSQRLIPSLDEERRVPACEILLGSPLILDLIYRDELNAIKEIMDKSTELGMLTFDLSLEKLYRDQKISLEEALVNADSKNTLRLKLNLANHENMTCPDSIHPPTHDPDTGLHLVD